MHFDRRYWMSVVFKDCLPSFSEETIVGECNCNCSLRKPQSGENNFLKNFQHVKINKYIKYSKKKKKCHYKAV